MVRWVHMPTHLQAQACRQARTLTRARASRNFIYLPFKWRRGHMDTLNFSKMAPVKSAAEVEAVIATIKTHMPETYKSIKAKAEAFGPATYALVRAGIRGQPNSFYAFERGHIVGTPFTISELTRDVAQLMCTLGVQHCIVWPENAAAS